MHLSLSAAGVGTGIPLWRVDVGEDGHWSYESRAVAHAEGRLPEPDRVQLKALYDKVNWQLETLNAPVSADDRTLFRLEVAHGDSRTQLYQSSEAMNHRSWQFRDLIHFLRHNVTPANVPVDWSPGRHEAAPPSIH